MAFLDVGFAERIHALIEPIDPTLHIPFHRLHGRFDRSETRIDMFLVVPHALEELVEDFVHVHFVHAESMRHAR
jgi:hypothetical protein